MMILCGDAEWSAVRRSVRAKFAVRVRCCAVEAAVGEHEQSGAHFVGQVILNNRANSLHQDVVISMYDRRDLEDVAA